MTKTKNEVAKVNGSSKDPKKKVNNNNHKSQKDSKKASNKNKGETSAKTGNNTKSGKNKAGQALQKTNKNSKTTKNAKGKQDKTGSGSNKSGKAVAKAKKGKKDEDDENSVEGSGKATTDGADLQDDSQLASAQNDPSVDKDSTNDGKLTAPTAPALGDEDKTSDSPVTDDSSNENNDHKVPAPSGNDADDTQKEKSCSTKKNATNNKKIENEAKMQPTEEDEEDEEESTKPTINQLKKNTRKMRALSQGEKIGTKEFEQLNDELTDLHGSVQTLKHSYGSIMNSLVALQKRRPKRNRKNQQKFGLISTPSTANIEDMAKQQNDEIDCYDIGHFLNPLTRDETFKMLFNEIEKLQDATEKFRSCFNNHGHFLQPKFDINCGKIVNRALYNQWVTQTYRLQTIVDEIIRNYNDDLLNLFRL